MPVAEYKELAEIWAAFERDQDRELKPWYANCMIDDCRTCKVHYCEVRDGKIEFFKV